MTLLAADKITVARRGKVVLRDICLTAHGGEFLAVIGPNGAGKSTLLATMAGLIKAERGTVSLDAKGLGAFAARDLAKRRAYLPQNPRLDWPLSVERLVAIGLLPKLPATGELPEVFALSIARALERCDLTGKRDQPATSLSGGEFARAMLARAIVGEPEILIADEPITGLDPRHAIRSMQVLAAFARSGALVVAALHDLTLAVRYATRVLVLVDGAVISDADSLTEEIIHRAFGVRALASGAGDSRAFTLLSPSEK